jgi:hypothetical protein
MSSAYQAPLSTTVTHSDGSATVVTTGASGSIVSQVSSTGEVISTERK